MSEVTVTVEIRGLAELEQRLRDESKKVAAKALRNAGRRAGDIWKTEIESRAPFRTGFLKAHVAIATTVRSGLEGFLRVVVGLKRGAMQHGRKVLNWPPFYAIFLEFGTRKMAAKPFMRPSFEAKKDEVLNTFVDETWNACQDLRER